MKFSIPVNHGIRMMISGIAFDRLRMSLYDHFKFYYFNILDDVSINFEWLPTVTIGLTLSTALQTVLLVLSPKTDKEWGWR